MTTLRTILVLAAFGQAGLCSTALAESPARAHAKVKPAKAKTPDAEPTPDPSTAPFRGVLGVMVGQITPKHRVMLGAPPTAGVVVRRVLPGSIAEVMGMQKLDVILDVAGATTRGAPDVHRALSQLSLGDLLIVQVIRNERPTTLFATLTEPAPKKKGVMADDAPKASASLSGRLHFVGEHSGIVIRPIDEHVPVQRTKSPKRRRPARR